MDHGRCARTQAPKQASVAGPKGYGPVGRWALGASVVAIASWFVVPLITDLFYEVYPITDTWVMPTIRMVLLDVAAVLNLLTLRRWRERSWLVVLATVLTAPLALLVTVFFVGEVLGS